MMEAHVVLQCFVFMHRAVKALKKKWVSYLNKLTAVTRSKLNKIERNKVGLQGVPTPQVLLNRQYPNMHGPSACVGCQQTCVIGGSYLCNAVEQQTVVCGCMKPAQIHRCPVWRSCL
jgi:hypothetical protein